MFFEAHISVPKDTTNQDPQIDEVAVTYGVIHYIELIPWGYAVDVLKARVERWTTTIFPTGEGLYVSFNGKIVAGRVHFPMLVAPFKLRVVSWNDSSKYAHGFTVRVWQLPPSVVQPAAEVLGTFQEWFLGLIGKGG